MAISSEESQAIQTLESSRSDSPEFATALTSLQRYCEGGSLTAALVLGHAYLQNPALPGGVERAHHFYQLAANQGMPQAIDRLADLQMLGWGCEVDDQQAFANYQKTAKLGFPAAKANLAYLLSQGIGCTANQLEASKLYFEAAMAGHLLAVMNLAWRFEEGVGVAADRSVACALTDIAAERDFPNASARAEKLRAELNQQQLSDCEDFKAALLASIRKVRGALADSANADSNEDTLSQLAAKEMTELGLRFIDNEQPSESSSSQEPSQWSAQSWKPRVLTRANFVSTEEIHFLLDLASNFFVATEDALKAGKDHEIDNFDGHCANLSPVICNAPIRNIQRRISVATRVAIDHFEPMSVLRYQVGHEYTPHVDSFSLSRMLAHEAKGDHGGQRLVTFLIYLMDPDAGGETVYQHADTHVQGQAGMGLMHFNVLPSGVPDPASLHTGMPIKAGEKWICRTGIRESSLIFDSTQTLK